MPKKIYLIIVCLALSPSPQAHARQSPASLQKECGYATARELEAAAQKAVSVFGAMDKYDPFFERDYTDAMRSYLINEVHEKNLALFRSRPQYENKYSWAKAVYEAYDKLRLNPAFAKLDAGDLQIAFTDDDGRCGGACTNNDSFAIFIPPQFGQQIYKQTGPAFMDFISFTIGHEFGHQIYSQSLYRSLARPSPGAYLDLENANEQFRELTIDAISAHLNDFSLEKVAALMRLDKIGLRKKHGDYKDRLVCLQKLVKTR